MRVWMWGPTLDSQSSCSVQCPGMVVGGGGGPARPAAWGGPGRRAAAAQPRACILLTQVCPCWGQPACWRRAGVQQAACPVAEGQLHLRGFRQCNGSLLQPVQLVQYALHGDVRNKMVHLVVVLAEAVGRQRHGGGGSDSGCARLGGAWRRQPLPATGASQRARASRKSGRGSIKVDPARDSELGELAGWLAGRGCCAGAVP